MDTPVRRHLSFAVEGSSCVATLDEASGTSGLLILSGGNEIRSGAHRGMAMLAQHVAAAGYPVLRFDRRGIGDSEGDNEGFESSGPDLRAALALFREQCPQLECIVAFGNCDAASARLLHHRPGGADALLLANPWTIDAQCEDADNQTSMPPPEAIRARYANKLKDPSEWLRLLRGGVNIGKLWRGLRAAIAPAATALLAERMRQAMGRIDAPITVLIAQRDTTAMAFMRHWTTSFDAERDNIALMTFDTASHGFADEAASEWLFARVVAALADQP